MACPCQGEWWYNSGGVRTCTGTCRGAIITRRCGAGASCRVAAGGHRVVTTGSSCRAIAGGRRVVTASCRVAAGGRRVAAGSLQPAATTLHDDSLDGAERDASR